MSEKDKKRISKFLSLVLRHKPEYIQISLDKNGWVNITELLEKSKIKNIYFSKEELIEIVKTNDKQRFALNENNTMIRANQGHSVKNVDLELLKIKPPTFLYHGTVESFIDSINAEGLLKKTRQHVHLSNDISTAKIVASRRGKPIVLTIKSEEMYMEGYTFFKSENNVWLTESVPPKFIIK